MAQLPQLFFTSSGLKSRNDEVRLRAAHDLQKYVSTELRELPAETYSSVLDEINQSIFQIISSTEVHEKKGGILAIGEQIQLSVDRLECVMIWYQAGVGGGGHGSLARIVL